MTVYCYDADEVRFIAIPKCANTSILAAMFDLDGTVERIHQIKPQQRVWGPEGESTFAVVRDPVQRAVSCWMNKVYEPHRPDTALLQFYGQEGIRRGMSFSEYLDVIETRGVDAFDQHVRPQRDFLPENLSDVVLLRFEHLDDDWREAGLESMFGPLGRLNESGVWPITQDDEWRLNTLYKNDVALHVAADLLHMGNINIKVRAAGRVE